MICVDASVVAKLFLPEDDSELAHEAFSHWVREEVEIVAPTLLTSEMVNILHQRVRRKQLDPDDARFLFGQYTNLPIEFVDELSVQREALTLATLFNLKSTHDAEYLALSDLLGAELWTADRRLIQSIEDRLPRVRDLRTWTQQTGPA